MSHQRRSSDGHRPEFQDANHIIEVKVGVAASRVVHESLTRLARALSDHPKATGYLVLVDTRVTESRLRSEWLEVDRIMRPDLAARLRMIIAEGDRLEGVTEAPDAETSALILDVIARERESGRPRTARQDASFIVLKILMLERLTEGRFVTSEWLARATGVSYPTIASVLRGLGGMIERSSDRRLRLRGMVREELQRLLSLSEKARSTTRFVDRSRSPRSIESHVSRLAKLAVPGIALGGVLGARHHLPTLDLTGPPRLDLSIHVPKRHLPLAFVSQLDPALERVTDPLEPATLVVHAVRHAQSFFDGEARPLPVADPIECLLDLHEARLETQASAFLHHLQQRRSVEP